MNSYFAKKIDEVSAYRLSGKTKDMVLNRIVKEKETYNRLKSASEATAEKYVLALEIVDLMNKWQGTVSAVGETDKAKDILNIIEQKFEAMKEG